MGGFKQLSLNNGWLLFSLIVLVMWVFSPSFLKCSPIEDFSLLKTVIFVTMVITLIGVL